MDDVKLTTFSTNADFAAELETHAFTSILKSLSHDFVQQAISKKNVLLLVPRKESLVLGKLDLNSLHSHLFYRNPHDIFQLISFSGNIMQFTTGQRAYISKSRVYLLGLITIPAGKTVWKMDEEALWAKFELPNELGNTCNLKLEKYDSIQLISSTPTLCHISSCDQSITASMIRRPIPEAREFESPRPEKKVPTGVLKLPTFFNKPPTQLDIMAPDAKIDHPDYACFCQRITESRFYLVALETKSFLNHVLNNNADKLSNVITGLGNFVSKINACISKIPINSEISDSFKRGLMSHVLLKIHSTVLSLAEVEEESNDLIFQIKLSLISLSKFSFADLGIEGARKLDQNVAWNELIRSVGSDLIFLSQSVSVKFTGQLITKCHQTISHKLEQLKIFDSSSNADILLPCLIIIIIRSHPPKIWITCHLLMQISSFAELEGVDQYCFTNFMAAITYINDSIDLHKLNISESTITEYEKLRKSRMDSR